MKLPDQFRQLAVLTPLRWLPWYADWPDCISSVTVPPRMTPMYPACTAAEQMDESSV